MLRIFITFALLALAGCAAIPPGRSSLEGTHFASLGLNLSTSVRLNRDGTYRRDVSLFYCSPLVIKSDDGKDDETLYGWTNTETGTWTVSDHVVLLEADERKIENPNVEEEYFEEVRSYPITYKLPQGWTLVYPSRRCILMTKQPNQALEPTPPSVTDRADARSAPAGGVAHL